MIRNIAFALLCALLTACASMGLAQPRNLPDRIAYGYSMHTAVQQTAANGVTAGELSSEDGEAILKLADQSRVLLNGAKATATTDPNGSAQKLDLAITVLQQIQAYLRAEL